MAHYTDPNAPMSVNASDKVQPIGLLVLAAGVVALAFVGLFYFMTASTEAATKELEDRIVQQDQQLLELQDAADELTSYNDAATSLHSLFDNQKRWEQVLGKIEASSYKKMRITSLQFTEKGEFTFTGITPSYEDYAKVYAAFTSEAAKEHFATFHVSSVAKAEKEGATDVTFTFQGTFTPAALAASK